MDPELFDRIARRVVGHEDDPVALTKGEVKALVEAFNQERDDHTTTRAILNDKNFEIVGLREALRRKP